MSTNVYEQLATTHGQSLADKLGTNHDIGNVVLGFLGKIIIMSTQLGKPAAGVEVARLIVNDHSNGDATFRAQVIFNDVAITAQSIWPPTSDFAAYARGKAASMAKALQTNPKLAFFFESLTLAIEQYAIHKRIPFEDLKVKQAIISTSNVMVLKLGRNLLDA